MKVLDRIAAILHVLCVLVLLFLTIIAIIARFIYKPLYEEQKGIDNVTEEIVSEDIKLPVYTITSEERYLLAKLVHSEASICSEECQRDVVSVVFNRLESGKWRKDMNNDGIITLYDIIYYPNAFTPATNGVIDKWEPTEKEYAAVDYVIQNGSTVPTEVRYFRTTYDFSWEGYKNYKVIDNVYFGYFEDWGNGVW